MTTDKKNDAYRTAMERTTERTTERTNGRLGHLNKWTVQSVYGIRGESTHRTPEAALKAAAKREGEGWIVIDEAGNQWGRNGRDAVIVHEASNV